MTRDNQKARTRRDLVAAAADDPVATRVDRLVDALHELTVTNDHLLRQMIRFTIDRDPIEPGVPLRPSRRLDYIEQALEPPRHDLPAGDYERLVHAMAVMIGVEARIVLRDMCGLDDAHLLRTQ